MRKGGMAVLAAVFSMIMSNAWANDEARLQFRNAIRTLERVQDATASGDRSAVDVQSKLIVQIETDLMSAKKVDLQDVRNLRAIATYLFSGGNPNIAERRFISLDINPENKHLLDGALAYARGEKANAIKFLGNVNLANLPPNLGGRVALVKAILVSAEDLKAALNLLGTASALMPGTLVEEAALRRCVSFAGKLPDIEQLELCASLYIRRFHQSVYWQEFEDSFTLGLIQADYIKAGGSMLRLKFILNDLPSVDNRKMLLVISKAAVGRGRFLLAKACAARAFEMSRADSVEMTRANLYAGAAMIVQEDHAAGKKKLESIEKSKLDPSDKALLGKALELTHQIASRPDITEEQAIKSLSPAELKDNQSPAYTSLLARAQNALADPRPLK
jgi:chemotaxis protein MotC